MLKSLVPILTPCYASIVEIQLGLEEIRNKMVVKGIKVLDKRCHLHQQDAATAVMSSLFLCVVIVVTGSGFVGAKSWYGCYGESISMVI